MKNSRRKVGDCGQRDHIAQSTGSLQQSTKGSQRRWKGKDSNLKGSCHESCHLAVEKDQARMLPHSAYTSPIRIGSPESQKRHTNTNGVRRRRDAL